MRVSTTASDLAYALRIKGELRDSIDAYRKAAELRPDYVVYHLNLATILRTSGQSKEAKAAYETMVDVINAKPEKERRPGDWGYLGQALYRLGRWEESRDSLEKVIQLRGENEPTLLSGLRWWYLTMALQQLGETGKAHEYYEQLVEKLDPTATESHKVLQAEAAEVLGLEQRTQPNN